MKKILIADDDPDIVRILSSRLKANGYEVITADCGVRAVTEAVKEVPNLIILDIKMPYGEGVGVFQQLKKYAQTLLIPVIIITGYSNDEMRKKAIEMGAIYYITKPFNPDDLLKKIKKLLGNMV